MSARRRLGDPESNQEVKPGLGASFHAREILTKRIPQNPRYQHIKSRLDTGSSMTKYTERLEEIKRKYLVWILDEGSLCHGASRSAYFNGQIKDYRYKKDELFKRLKVTTFAQLVIQVASLSEANSEVPPEETQKLDEGDAALAENNVDATAETNGRVSPDEKPASPILFINNTGAGESYRSTLQSVISGVGELDLGKDGPKKTETCAKDGPYPDCPYLLLDVRERDAYDQGHIVGAYSYPIATLSRTMNPYTNNILEYSNQEVKPGLGASFHARSQQKNAYGKIIIVYDDDERVASQAATTMCERGFENLFMLSGGLRVVAQKVPEGLLTGSFPASCLSAGQPGTARRKATPRQPLPPPAGNKWRFTAEDLQKIQHYLEEEHLPSDTASRLSRGSSARDTKAMAVKSSQNLPATNSTVALTARSLSSSTLQNKPWR